MLVVLECFFAFYIQNYWWFPLKPGLLALVHILYFFLAGLGRNQAYGCACCYAQIVSIISLLIKLLTDTLLIFLLPFFKWTLNIPNKFIKNFTFIPKLLIGIFGVHRPDLRAYCPSIYIYIYCVNCCVVVFNHFLF